MIIPNDEDMNKFLKLIIHRMKTVDGNKDSASKIIELMNSDMAKAKPIGKNGSVISEH